MQKKKQDRLYEKIKNDLFDLLDLLEIKIDSSYILEELENIFYQVKKLKSVDGDPLDEEIINTYNQLYKKYKNKLAAFLDRKDTEKLEIKLKDWIRRLAFVY